MAQLKNQLLAAMPDAVRRIVAPDSRGELRAAIDASLLLFERELVHLESGERVAVADDAAATLAAGAVELLRDRGASGVALLLPPREFVATSSALPGVTADSLESALALQQDMLLPACEQDLAMSVNPASATLGEDHIALWLPRARLDALHAAFAGHGLPLAAVAPRPLAAADSDGELRVSDSDSAGMTAAALNQGVIMQWLHVQQADLDDEAFREQWQQELKSYPMARAVTLNSADDYRNRAGAATANAYWFHPGAALAARRQVERGRRLAAAAVGVAVLAVLAALPYLWQALELRSASAELAETREAAADARADQAVVARFESEWGPVYDYPEQDVREALFTLQEAISPDRLTSLELSEGLISIEGTSDDPQAILQNLEQNPLFTEVAFARATNNTRYYIDLRLSPVNFEAYRLRYFPDD